MAFRLTEAEYRRFLAGDGLPAGAPKRSKYGSRKVVVDGITWDSEFEASHYQALKRRQQAGEIRNLRWHVMYKLHVAGALVCKYEADFVFDELQPGGDWFEDRIEDTKSEPTRRTRAYRIKYKLMAAQGHHIREVMNTRWSNTSRRLSSAPSAKPTRRSRALRKPSSDGR